MGVKPRFFCESCGAEVAKNAKFCKHCGKFFAAVLCPKCGCSGPASVFSKGCPSCGYAVGTRADLSGGKISSKTKKNAQRIDPLPLWVYIVVVCILIGLIWLFLR